MAINYIQLTGNMLQPEMRTTQTGKTIAKASMVVKTYGEDTDDMWVDVTAWEKLAENLNASFPTNAKSMRVMVEGTLKKETWEDRQTGQSKSKYLVNANNISVCLDYQTVSGASYSGDGNNSGTSFANNQSQPAPAQPVARPMSEIAEGEAPF